MTPNQSRAARALIDMTQPQLATAAAIGLSTVVDFEKNRRTVPQETIAKLRTALEGAGVEFIPASDKGAGVRFKKPSDPALVTR